MIQTPQEFIAGVRAAKLVGIVRGTSSSAATAAALALLEEGFRYVEVAMTTPQATDVIAAIRAEAPPGVHVGAGTVLSIQDVKDVEAAGAQFIVTPAVTDSIAEAVRRGLPVLAGALTPTDVYEGMQRGATMIKLFPAFIGGPRYVKALLDPFPQVHLVAVGGVGANDAASFWAAGAAAVGPGSPLVGDAASAGGDLDAMRARARNYVRQAANQARDEG